VAVSVVDRFGLIGRNPVYRHLWAARVVSFLGDTMAQVALVLAAYQVVGTGGAVGLLLLAQALPRLLGPLTGTLADRVDQRRLLLACDVAQALLFGLIALALPPFPLLVGLVALASVLATVSQPAGRGALPALVDADDLTAANALLGAGVQASFSLGPALGGLIVAALGVRGALAADALTFVLSAGLLTRLPALPPAPGTPGDAPAPGVLRETGLGLAFVARHRTARAVALGLFLTVAFAALDNVALVFLARRSLHATARDYGLLASAYGVGMVLASLLILRRSNRSTPAALFLLGVALQGIGTALTGLAPALAAAIVTQGMAGVGNSLENLGTTTLIQRTVPRPLLGRAFGIVFSAASIAEAVAYAAGGVLLGLISPRAVFVLAGVGVLAALVIVWLLLPRASSDVAEAISGHG